MSNYGAVVGASMGLYALVCIALYVIQALGIKKIIEVTGRTDGWKGFVPILNMYAFGEIIAEITGAEGFVALCLKILWIVPCVNFVALFIWIVYYIKMLCAVHASAATIVTLIVCCGTLLHPFMLAKDIEAFYGEVEE
jgi:hypothetical protein